MLAGHTVEEDGLIWTLTLREGLLFHDNTPVLGRDVVASVKRWGKLDACGQALLAATEDLSAPQRRVRAVPTKTPVRPASGGAGSSHEHDGGDHAGATCGHLSHGAAHRHLR